MIEVRDLLDGVIRPTLSYMGPRYTGRAAECLLLGTAAAESRLGEDLIQDLSGGRHGPALGIWQMEPATANDIRDNWLRYNPDMLDTVVDMRGEFPREWAKPLAGNLYFACAMARLHYWRVKAPMPTDLDGWAKYWKTYFNTPLGKGTEAKFKDIYRAIVAPYIGE